MRTPDELARSLRGSVRNDKVEKTLHEYKEGTLKSGSGQPVTERKQAIAIALNQARKAGENVAPKK